MIPISEAIEDCARGILLLADSQAVAQGRNQQGTPLNLDLHRRNRERDTVDPTMSISTLC
jgi:hypothetical protein